MVLSKSYHRFINTGILFFLFANLLQAQQPKRYPVVPDKFCISSNEFILAKMINDYRRQNNLADIPISKSLFFVAYSHVQDLAQNQAYRNNCGLHSWSENGDWNPCCYLKEDVKTNCMNDKPKELTGYKGKGYEMIYWGSEEAIPADAIEVWKSTALTNEMMLNQGKWNTKTWKSIGIGLLDGYASVWFGDETDPSQGIKLCQNDSIVKNQLSDSTTSPVIKKGLSENHYFLIIGSFKSREQAAEQVASLVKKGIHDTFIIEKDNIFRVALASYHSLEEAQKNLNKHLSRFKGIWIYHY
jgi:hypothetical protein